MTALRDYELSVAVSVDPDRYSGNKGDKGRVAPGCYAIIAPSRTPGRAFIGSGYVANPEALFAHGVMHVLDDILIDELEEISDDGDNFRLNVSVKKAGTQKYLDEHVPNWMRQADLKGDGHRPNSFTTWKRFYTLSRLGKIVLSLSSDATQNRLLGKLQTIARSEGATVGFPDRGQQEAIIGSRELPFPYQ